MNILFISIFDMTKVFYEISINLEKEGHTVFWIANSPKWYEWLLERNVAIDKILFLDVTQDSLKKNTLPIDIVTQMNICEEVSGLTFNNTILIDRFLVNYDENYINEVTKTYYYRMKTFLENNKVNTVFSEPTNLHELMCYMICKELNIRYIAPWDMRFPSYRLIFIESIYQNKLLSRVPAKEQLDGEIILEDFIIRKPTPSYFHIINKKTSYTSYFRKIMKKILGFINVETSLTHYLIKDRIVESIQKYFGKFYLNNITKRTTLSEKFTYALYPLHVQPENSIDVLGAFSSNQVELIKNIVRSLPYGMKLIVKEHANSFGAKGVNFYRDVKNIKNVVVINSKISNFELYKRVKLVLSISGTSCYESAMLGIPSIVFAQMYFDDFSCIRYVKDIKNLQLTILELLNQKERDMKHDISIMQKLLDNSYNCYWTDPLHNEAVLEEKNIKCLSNAFLSVTSSLENSE